jgi:flagellar capping protein FliD
MDTPQIDDFLLWTAGIVIAVTAISGGLAALYRLLTGSLSKRLDGIASQLQRNGGSSLRDAVDRIEEKQTEIQRDVRDVRQRLDDHIAYHLDKEL